MKDTLDDDRATSLSSDTNNHINGQLTSSTENHVVSAAEEHARIVNGPHHMKIHWHEIACNDDCLAIDATLADKTSLISRTGLLMLSAGTGSWRVRDIMNQMARMLEVTCNADVSLVTLECMCADGDDSYTEVLSLPATGVNTERIQLLETFLSTVKAKRGKLTVHQIHRMLDKIEQKPKSYSSVKEGLAAAIACASFIFLLGAGPIEMICAFIGAGLGNFVRSILIKKRFAQLACIGSGVGVACLSYLAALNILALFMPTALDHEAGYIGAMLFIIPGFPLITSGLDLIKMDLRSGVERFVYALTVILVATMVGWVVAEITNLHPGEFAPLGLDAGTLCMLRLIASFFGVFGFSIMFNSPLKVAIVAGLLGAVSNTLRLEMIDFATMPPELAAFIGALVAGLIASVVGPRLTMPRISLTVPSIVLMVPGMYLYQSMFYMGDFIAGDAVMWTIRAWMVIAFLPMGLGLARILTDKRWRHRS
ncbi:MAG: threonine/serine exporter family protein [Eggerthellaceae bacterium]|nr:threonine/serine exporter family protein [Eggerthellaceae bacterium]MCH4221592.1 threonine/serine exporter family protein [Eggerthellaceae bacterium]